MIFHIIIKPFNFMHFQAHYFKLSANDPRYRTNLNSNFHGIKGIMGINPQDLEIVPTKLSLYKIPFPSLDWNVENGERIREQCHQFFHFKVLPWEYH